jgi:hypothetical protein
MTQQLMEAVYAGRFGSAVEQRTCPLCYGQRMHSGIEHRNLLALIRHPLEFEVWGDVDDGFQIISRGHHPADWFIARIRTDPELAWALDLADIDDPKDLTVEHLWRRYRPRSRYEDSEWHGAWWDCAGPAPGACPFTVVMLP